jgi:NAD(P)H-flavin reductase
MKSLYSPLNLAFGCSHEQLNPWHRLSGRVIYGLLFLHATWYLNYFIQAGVLVIRLTSRVVIIGYVAFFLMNILFSTSLEKVRRWSYRVFFICHLIIGMILPPLLFFHATPLRIYVTEALALFVFDIICRKLDTITSYATITPVPHTKLVKLRIPVPASKIRRFQDAPGQHVYLQIPPESTTPHTPNPSVHDLLFNPFTIASVSNTEVTLVLRALHGPTTTTLEYLSHLSKAHPPINIEGPIGSSRHFPNIAADYDRILLVAGGVGSTFILPIYQNVRDQLVAEAKSPDRATFVWSMRSPYESLWAVDSSSTTGSEEGASIQNDENVQIFVTGQDSFHSHNEPEPQDGSLEMRDMSWNENDVGIKIKSKERPDLGTIVDSVFRRGEGERVAILVCGPAGMARELRRSVGRWVEKGRNVWFHDESFGW